jgi:CO dehydrogenase maturation factor
MKIAISGKGGVGKTTISSMIALGLVVRGKTVLAIDADPNGSLAEALGYDQEKNGRITPLIEQKQLIEERTGSRPGDMGGYFVLNPRVDDLVEKFSIEVNGIRVIVMGGLKEALSGCYCSENALLRSFLRHLMVERDEWVILDMEAGFEHLTRGTAQSVDLLLIVVEPGSRSISTAKKLTALARQAGIPDIGYIFNKLYSGDQIREISTLLGSADIRAAIPFDDKAVEADLKGAAPYATCPETKAHIDRLLDGFDLL